MRNNIFLATLSNILFNTAIAGLLTAINFGEGFLINLAYSQCIGLSIYTINASVVCRVANPRHRWMVLALTFPGSIMLGVTLAAKITGVGDWYDPHAWIAVVIGLFFGGIGSITYFLNRRIEQLDSEVKQRQYSQMESEKRQMEAQLKMLQAQIEPHFLFNTLANVSSLIDSDPILAKQLLERLNDWLRIALLRTRNAHATLGDELDMLSNYLNILNIRFGNRLRWQIDIADKTRRQPFPPMLLQPLVENAVRHGIEPKLGGGEIIIRATWQGDTLRIEVSDDGMGMSGASVGAGLENVRTRLAALFGSAGRLTLENNPDAGATATLELPV